MLRSYFSECSRQSFNIAVVESCRVESRLSFDRGKGIETDCPLLFVAAAAAAAATFCERWKDGYQPTRTTRHT